MKFRQFLFAVISLPLVISSCVKDTCNGALGNTFDTIELDSVYLNGTETLKADFSVVSLDDLPETYFANIIHGDSLTELYTDTITVTKTSLSFVFSEAAIPDSTENKDFTLNYIFSDRRNYVDCQHPGSSDSYYLMMEFNLYNSDNTTFEITDFEWNEIFAAGHL